MAHTEVDLDLDLSLAPSRVSSLPKSPPPFPSLSHSSSSSSSSNPYHPSQSAPRREGAGTPQLQRDPPGLALSEEYSVGPSRAHIHTICGPHPGESRTHSASEPSCPREHEASATLSQPPFFCSPSPQPKSSLLSPQHSSKESERGHLQPTLLQLSPRHIGEHSVSPDLLQKMALLKALRDELESRRRKGKLSVECELPVEDPVDQYIDPQPSCPIGRHVPISSKEQLALRHSEVLRLQAFLELKQRQSNMWLPAVEADPTEADSSICKLKRKLFANGIAAHPCQQVSKASLAQHGPLVKVRRLM